MTARRRRLLVAGLLVLVWLALWERITWANLLSGATVAGIVSALLPDRPDGPAASLRPLAALGFVAHVATKMAAATALVAWEVVTPRNRINEGIVAVPTSAAHGGLLVLIANVISLTPGTLTVDIDDDAGVLYVRVLHLRSVDAVRADVARLEQLALSAFAPIGAGRPVDQPAAQAR